MSDNTVDNTDAVLIEGEYVEQPESTTSRVITFVAAATIGVAVTYGMVKFMEKRDARRAAKMQEEVHVVTDLEDQSTAS